MSKKETKNTSRELAVLGFLRQDDQATVVTDGEHVRSYEPSGCKSHRSLSRAIAYLESLGYNIEMEANISYNMKA